MDDLFSIQQSFFERRLLADVPTDDVIEHKRKMQAGLEKDRVFVPKFAAPVVVEKKTQPYRSDVNMDTLNTLRDIKDLLQEGVDFDQDTLNALEEIKQMLQGENEKPQSTEQDA